MQYRNESLFSGRVSAGRTTYFIDVRQAVNGRFYITLTESRRVSESGFDQSRIFLFEETVEEVAETLGQALSTLTEAASGRGPLPEDADELARRGKNWTEEEEELLKEEYSKNTELEQISKKLRRSTHALRLRLEKLGLVKDTAATPAS